MATASLLRDILLLNSSINYSVRFFSLRSSFFSSGSTSVWLAGWLAVCLSPFLSPSLSVSVSQVSLLGNEVEIKQALKYLMSHAIKVSSEESVVRVRGVIVDRLSRVRRSTGTYQEMK